MQNFNKKNKAKIISQMKSDESLFYLIIKNIQEDSLDGLIEAIEQIIKSTERLSEREFIYGIDTDRINELREDILYYDDFKRMKGYKIDFRSTIAYHLTYANYPKYNSDTQYNLSTENDQEPIIVSDEFFLNFLKDLKEGKIRLYYKLDKNDIYKLCNELPTTDQLQNLRYFLKEAYGLEFENKGAYIELIKDGTGDIDSMCDCKSTYRFSHVLNESTEFLNFYSEHKNTKKATGEVIYHRIRYILPINDYINFNKYVNFIFHVEAGNWDY